MTDQFPRFPLQAFFAPEQAPGQTPEQLDPNPAMLPTLTGANLIFGRDVTTGTQFLVFGRELLHAIVRSGTARPVSGLVIEIDHGEESDDLEKLCALMRAVKGHDDYQEGETFSEE